MASQLTFDELVQLIEVAIGPELAREVPDRQTTLPKSRQEIIARKEDNGIFVLQHTGPAGKNLIDEPARLCVGDGAKEDPA